METTEQKEIMSHGLLLTIEDASKLLNLKVSRLRKAIFHREINYVKLGGLVRFRLVDLEQFIQTNLVKCN